jgi:hypothetical protein
LSPVLHFETPDDPQIRIGGAFGDQCLQRWYRNKAQGFNVAEEALFVVPITANLDENL